MQITEDEYDLLVSHNCGGICPCDECKRIGRKRKLPDLQDVLRCVEVIQECNSSLQRGSKNPLFTMVGVMDWTQELWELTHDENGDIKR